MTDNSDNTISSETVKDTHLIPTTASGKRLVWSDSNDARLDGLLLNFNKFTVRAHLFQEYFKHHAARVGTKLAVDSPNAIPFLLGFIDDKYNASDRCPPTGKRIAQLTTHSPRAAPSSRRSTQTRRCRRTLSSRRTTSRRKTRSS